MNFWEKLKIKRKKKCPGGMYYRTGHFLYARKFRRNLLAYKKPYRAGSHCGGKVDVARGDPPQAENPAKQDSFLKAD